MAGIRFTIYKSVFATIIGFFGTTTITMGVVLFAISIFNSEDLSYIPYCVITVICGVIINIVAKKVNEFHITYKIRRALQKSDEEQLISASINQAIELYNLFPCKSMHRYISKINPDAGNVIIEALSSRNKKV